MMFFFKPPNVKKLKARRNVKGLIKALRYKKDWSVRRAAALALGEIGDARAVEPLIAALKDNDENVRRAAAWALDKLGWQPDTSEASEPDMQENLDIAQEYFEKGAEFAKLQKWQQAIEAFKEAVRINPKHSRAHMGLCLAYAAILDLDTARHHYEILKQIDPDLAEQVANTPAGIMILRAGGIIFLE